MLEMTEAGFPIRMSNPVGNLREYFMEEYEGDINRAFLQYHNEFVTECESRTVPPAFLESRLFPPPPPAGTARPEPDWTVVQHELRRKGVTLLLLWQKYKEREPDGFQYSWFCHCYRAWQPVGLFA